MQLEVSGFDSFKDLLDIDPYFSPILVAVRGGERTNYLVHEGFCLRANSCAFLIVV